MKFGHENTSGKVVLNSLLFENLFLSYNWDEENNILDFGSESFWATDPKMKFDLTEIIEKDIEGFKLIPIENDGRWADWNDVYIYRILISEGKQSTFTILYAFKCGHSENDKEGGYRTIRGYNRELFGTDYSRYGRPNSYEISRHPLREEQELKILW